MHGVLSLLLFTILRTPTDDSADTLARFRGYPRRCRGKPADFRRGQSADFVKFLLTSTVIWQLLWHFIDSLYKLCTHVITKVDELEMIRGG